MSQHTNQRATALVRAHQIANRVETSMTRACHSRVCIHIVVSSDCIKLEAGADLDEVQVVVDDLRGGRARRLDLQAATETVF